MTTIQRDELSLEERLERASIDVEAKRRTLDASIEHRDRLVVELYDTGATVSRVRKASHLSHARIAQIIARRG